MRRAGDSDRRSSELLGYARMSTSGQELALQLDAHAQARVHPHLP
jgi:hypothetical protein